jgi:hypothetical protein
MGKMIFTVLGAVAELERNLIKERISMGLDRAIALQCSQDSTSWCACVELAMTTMFWRSGGTSWCFITRTT